MAFIKYSIGGKITKVQDRDENVATEESSQASSMTDDTSYLIVCGKCKLQHMVLQGEVSRACNCGNTINLKELS